MEAMEDFKSMHELDIGDTILAKAAVDEMVKDSMLSTTKEVEKMVEMLGVPRNLLIATK